MKIKSRYVTSVFVIATLLLSMFFFIRYFFVKSQPYPSLAKQREALVNKPSITPTRLLDSISIVADVAYLASDTCEGRQPGSIGHEKAVERIVFRMREAGLDSFNNSLIQPFTAKWVNLTTAGKNIVGWIKGTRHPEKYIVISAHYDHLGKRDHETYYGASDNASGTACLLAMSKYFKKNPLSCSLIFAVFDREESGLEGSLSFVNHLPSPLKLSNIRLNLNIDMIARNDSNEIFAVGVYHKPSLIYAVREIQNKTLARVLMGHDQGDTKNDWTNQSDHYVFHEKGIPFLYIGVEDHPDYHKPTDTYDKFTLTSYIENCNMIVLLAKAIKL